MKNIGKSVLLRFARVCEYTGIKYVPETNRLYRVQVGAFSNKKNAEKLAEELKKKGYNNFIV